VSSVAFVPDLPWFLEILPANWLQIEPQPCPEDPKQVNAAQGHPYRFLSRINIVSLGRKIFFFSA